MQERSQLELAENQLVLVTLTCSVLRLPVETVQTPIPFFLLPVFRKGR